MVLFSLILSHETSLARLSNAQLEELIKSVFASGHSPEQTLRLIARNLPRLDKAVPEEKIAIGLIELTRGNIYLQSTTGDRNVEFTKSDIVVYRNLESINIR